MKKSFFVAVICLCAIAASGWGFDGNRRGLLIGGGFGFGPIARTSRDAADNGASTRSGLAIDFQVGYAWNNKNAITYLRNAIIYSQRASSGSDYMIQGFSGLAWSHFFRAGDKSAYTTLGLGIQTLATLDGDYGHDAGVGLLVGGGYEFIRHIRLHSSVSYGRTHGIRYSYNHIQLQFGVSAFAF